MHQSTPAARFQSGHFYKVVEDIVSGDLVLAKDEATGELIYSRVQQTFIRQADRIYKIRYEDGTLIETTWSHPFYVRGKGWIEARYLRAGDIGETAAGQGLRIASVEIDPRYETTFNFEVQEHHNYFVSEAGVLVHNESYSDFRRRVLAADPSIHPSVLAAMDGELANIYTAVRAEHGEAAAQDLLRRLSQRITAVMPANSESFGQALGTAGANSGGGAMATNSGENGDILIGGIKYSYSLVAGQGCGGAGGGQGDGGACQTPQITVDAQASTGAPRLHFGVEATGTLYGRPTSWLEVLDVDQAARETRFSNMFTYELRPGTSTDPEIRNLTDRQISRALEYLTGQPAATFPGDMFEPSRLNAPHGNLRFWQGAPPAGVGRTVNPQGSGSIWQQIWHPPLPINNRQYRNHFALPDLMLIDGIGTVRTDRR